MTEEPRTEAQMRSSAELVVDTCFEVKDGDVVTIITDDRRKPEAEMVATVVAERGGLPIVANNEAQIRRALADTLFPMVPPRNLHQAMVTSDQIIIMTNLEWANRFAHVPAVKESVANMARIGSIEEGFGRWPISVADIEQTIGNAKKAIARLEGMKRVRVTSPAGTDVVVSIERRPALEVVPVKQPGAMMGPAPLWGEVAYAAVEDQTNGTIVIDGNMLDVITGVPGTETVAEFAFGTSDFAPVGDPSEKGRKGTVHFALGDNQNCYPGGQNKSVLHLDGVCHNVSLQILDTGEYLVKDGVWQL
jgi:leucyl aminopeptidase (aminopeptidase T)